MSESPLFRFLVAAPFCLKGLEHSESAPLILNGPADLDEALSGLAPGIYFRLSDALPGGLAGREVDIRFNALRDFKPAGLMEACPLLADLVSARKLLAEAGHQGLRPGDIKRQIRQRWPWIELSWPDEGEGDMSGAAGTGSKGQADVSSLVSSILDQVAIPDEGPGEASKAEGRDRPAALPPQTDQLDGLIRSVMSEIFSNSAFRQLEESWRGLFFLLKAWDFCEEVEFQLFCLDRQECDRSLDLLIEKSLGYLPQFIVFDLQLGASPLHFSLLERMAGLCEMVLAPGFTGISPAFFHLDSWHDLDNLSYIPNYLDSQQYAKWKALRSSPASRWLGACCNRFILRLPYGALNPARPIPFSEPEPLWGNPVWAVGALLGRSVELSGWPANFGDWGRVYLEDVAVMDDGSGRMLAVESLFRHERLEQLMKAGLMALSSPVNQDVLFVAGERAISGDSLAYSLMIGLVSHFLMEFKQRYRAEEIGGRQELSRLLLTDLVKWWEQHGTPAPDDVSVDVKEGEGKGFHVKLVIRPQASVIMSRPDIILEFDLS